MVQRRSRRCSRALRGATARKEYVTRGSLRGNGPWPPPRAQGVRPWRPGRWRGRAAPASRASTALCRRAPRPVPPGPGGRRRGASIMGDEHRGAPADPAPRRRPGADRPSTIARILVPVPHLPSRRQRALQNLPLPITDRPQPRHAAQPPAHPPLETRPGALVIRGRGALPRAASGIGVGNHRLG
ncbi:hypothetical protein HMPREF9005_2077 [Actinomyces sp. oral taxon 178 str. F0338]|nr:hypothetical protein HMPREF9005_2077 [Actinomyces sp. oral taxon 178 str. F0338]